MTTTRGTYIDLDCKGTNRACKAARKQGRNVHIIPGHVKGLPRLILPTYHFKTKEEALEFVANAERSAPVVKTDADLYIFRQQLIAHKISVGWTDPTRR